VGFDHALSLHAVAAVTMDSSAELPAQVQCRRSPPGSGRACYTVADQSQSAGCRRRPPGRPHERQLEEIQSRGFFDELITPKGTPRQVARPAVKLLRSCRRGCRGAAHGGRSGDPRDGYLLHVYSEAGNIDRAWPFDLIPRVITAREWAKVRRGLEQRSRALNMFIHDVYNKQKIFADGVVPAETVLESSNFKAQCLGASPRFGVWAHICGSDLIRNRDGQFYVLEDNLRVPSGVSYMVENREITKRVLPEMFENYSILPVDDYPTQLYRTLAALSPRERKRP
jgi:uncharacterized circularly permuted ATP-grasp superfamily protein